MTAWASKAMAKKAAKKNTAPRKSTKSGPAPGKTAKAQPMKPGVKGHAAAAESQAAPIAALTKPEVEKIQGLLKSRTSDGVTLGLSLLESLGATPANCEAVFTETVKRAVGRIANEWVQGGEATKAEYVRYHGLLVRPAFLSACGDAGKSQKPFIDLVDIPAGSFMMGSPKNEADRGDNENQVQVRITKPFRMGRTVVTKGQWRAVMGTEPSWHMTGYVETEQFGDDFPAVDVTWHDAVLFCETLTDLERETGRLTASQSYRLPTEAEWEYACRAGTTTVYSFGDDPKQLGKFGWFRGNSGKKLRPRGNQAKKLHPVAQKKANPWGLFDMHGNVWEWCSDWRTDLSGSIGLAGGDDPQGPTDDLQLIYSNADSLRVYRGGSWGNDASFCRSAYRSYAPGRTGDFGFRVVVLCAPLMPSRRHESPRNPRCGPRPWRQHRPHPVSPPQSPP